MIQFNEGSNDHLSVLLYGGTLFYKDIEVIGIIKTSKNKGLEKTRTVKKEFKTKGLGINPRNEWKGKKEGFFSSNEKILEYIAVHGTEDAKNITNCILSIRKLNKELSTYFENTKEVIYDIDGCIHPSFIHVKTQTARLSHRGPNMGNQPKPPSKATQHFVSRHKNGIIMVADYKSLEPRVEAQLSEDNILRQDVINGIDPHIKHLALAEKMKYDDVAKLVNSDEVWKAKRSQIKGFTFSQQYLAGEETTARNSGLSVLEVRELIKARKIEYAGLYAWHNKNMEKINDTGRYVSPLGQVFYFRQYPNRNGGMYYSPNEASNYMTQGTAGCIVNIMIGRFWREKAIHNRDKYLMVNTVHDNLILDTKSVFRENARKDLKTLENWKNVCYTKFLYKWDIDLIVEISEGKNWYECF